jgi:hypothetical protein
MNLIQLVVIGMILTILATITLAVVSYAAFKVRQNKSPVRGGRLQEGPLFFERVRLEPGPGSEG